jgi:hypothetical protein
LQATAGWAPFCWLPLLIAWTLLALVMRSFWGFVQDDAYISLRYSQNLARGIGLVFNAGERVEGFTNLSWTVLGAALCRAGIDPLDGLRVIGAVAALALVWLVWREAGGDRWRAGWHHVITAGLAALVLSSSTTLAVWSVSGLEQSAFTALLFAGYHLFCAGRFRAASVAWLLATLTRPEAPLAVAIAVAVRGGALAVRRTRRRGVVAPRTSLRPELEALALYGTGFLGLLAFRCAYFGELVPNTFFVKGAASLASHRHGLQELGRFLVLNVNGVVLALAVVGMAGAALVRLSGGTGAAGPARGGESEDATAGRRPDEELAFSAAFLAAYAYYVVRIGGDLLPLFRLYMPLLPFAALWAARTVTWLSGMSLTLEDAGTGARARVPGAVLGTMAALLLAVVLTIALRDSRSRPEFAGTIAALEKCHGEVGRYLERVARARSGRPRPLTVLAQDMGLTPYRAPSVRFVDVIGLTDATIARTLYEFRYTPYTRYLQWADPAYREQVERMERQARAYLASQKADYVIINVTCEAPESEAVREAMSRRDAAYFASRISRNTFYYGLADTGEFKRDYRLAAAFEYSAVHGLLLYERQALAPVSR